MVISSERSKLSDSKRQIRLAIISAYGDKKKLEIMVSDQFRLNLDQIAGGSDLEEVVFNLIKTAESEGWLEKLIRGAIDSNPGNSYLQAIQKELLPKLSDLINVQNRIDSISIGQWNELYTILDKIDDLVITQICHQTLKNIQDDILGNYPELIGNIEYLTTIRTILIDKCPRRKDGVPTIIEFVERLRNHKKIQPPQQNDLKKWVIEVADNLSINLPTYNEKKKSFRCIEYYLLITVNPILTKANKFELKAELSAENLQNKERITDNILDRVECSLEQIANEIHKIIKIAIDYYIKSQKHELIIELFLPLKWLSESIDLQQIPIDYTGRKKPIGTEYNFLVRCLERFDLNHRQYSNKLSIKWDVLEERLKDSIYDSEIKNFFHNLSNFDNCNWDQIELELENKFGIKITCCLPDYLKKEDLYFYTIMREGIPIALWIRNDRIPNIDINKEFDNILKLAHLQDLNKLFKSIKSIRKIAHSKGNEAVNYLGYHLGFLCDNPYRIPSCFDPDSEFIEVGE